MFYTLEEAAARLGKSPDEVKAMCDSRQLEMFRDRDRVMLKVEQVDLLAGAGRSDDDIIPLAESGELEPISAASSGSGTGINVENPKEQTGASIFNIDDTEDSDPSAVTRVTTSPSINTGDPGKSGSGLVDLAREFDETRLGSMQLDPMYEGSSSADQTSGDSGMGVAAAGGGGALFEGAGAEAQAVPMMAALAEPYDGPGSGLIGGLALGILVCLGVTAFAVLLALAGGDSGGALLAMLGDNLYPVLGGMAGFTLVAAIVGLLLGKRS